MEGRPADGELFKRAQRGDVAAYEEIVHRYQQVAFRTAYVITGSAADAEDAAQEGFVKAYRALATFRPDAEPRPWLLRIVANEARNRVRSTGRRQALELRLAEGYRPGAPANCWKRSTMRLFNLAKDSSGPACNPMRNPKLLVPISGR